MPTVMEVSNTSSVTGSKRKEPLQSTGLIHVTLPLWLCRNYVSHFLGCNKGPTCFPSSYCRAFSRLQEEIPSEKFTVLVRDLSSAVGDFWKGWESLVSESWRTTPSPFTFTHTHTTTNTYPTHPSNLSCREVLENTMWLQIRKHWQMSGGLFFWVETECIVRQNLCWQKRKVRGGCYESTEKEKQSTSGHLCREGEEGDKWDDLKMVNNAVCVLYVQLCGIPTWLRLCECVIIRTEREINSKGD